ncbi:MAG: alpha/beta hydrolase [Treponema sp.]|nr:alpha/beta hydrolase [Treponema sp.]
MLIRTIVLMLILFSIGFLTVKSIKPAKMCSQPKLHTEEELKIRCEKEGFWQIWETLPKEEFWVKSFDDYELYCILNKQSNFEKNKKIVIISHGLRGMHLNSIKYANLFWKLGFSTVVYDLRGHGKTKSHNVKLGLTESKDLYEIVQYLKNKFGDDTLFGLHGESMGAVTTLFATKKLQKENLMFTFSDCAFYSAKKFIKDALKKEKKPVFMYYFINLASVLKFRLILGKVNPYKAITKVKTPICFIHGDKDELISASHMTMLYDSAKHCPKMKISFPEAEHAKCIIKDAFLYEKTVKEFLKNTGLFFINEF